MVHFHFLFVFFFVVVGAVRVISPASRKPFVNRLVLFPAGLGSAIPKRVGEGGRTIKIRGGASLPLKLLQVALSSLYSTPKKKPGRRIS